MIMMTAMGGKNTMQNTALEEDRRRRKKAIKRLFWRRRRNSRTYKLRPAIKPLLLVAADTSLCAAAGAANGKEVMMPYCACAR
jgi:hypothetical protein